MIILLKVLHSAIFFSITGALAALGWAALTGEASRLTWVAVSILLVEVAAVALTRGACPITAYTERWGAKSGSVVHLFLPGWLASRAFEVGGTLALVSLLILSIRLAFAS